MVKNSNRQIGDRPKTSATFRVDAELLERLRQVAESKGVSQIYLLEKALETYFNQLEEQKR